MAQWQKIKFYWDTMLGSKDSILSATSTASGYDVENLFNMLEWKKWKAGSGAVPMYINYDNVAGAGHTGEADYLVILGHNLNTLNARVTLQYSTDGFTADINDAFTGEKPSSDGVYLKEFTNPGPKRYWRLKIEENLGGGMLSPVPYMAICIWGLKTELDYASAGFDPYEEEIKANVTRSDTGYVLGVHDKYRERRMTLRFEDADDALYQKIKDWWDGNGLRNFFVAWERGNRPDDVFLMMSEPKFNNPFKMTGRRDITISLVGRRE